MTCAADQWVSAIAANGAETCSAPSANFARLGTGQTWTATQTFTGGASFPNGMAQGTGTGTDFAPLSGLITRRVNSLSPTNNAIVAQSGTTSLQRDGTNGGIKWAWNANPGNVNVACYGVTGTGSVIGFYNSQASPGPAGAVQVFTNAQDVRHYHCMFGDAYNAAGMTTVDLDRYTGDYYLIGHMVSSVTQ